MPKLLIKVVSKSLFLVEYSHTNLKGDDDDEII